MNGPTAQADVPDFGEPLECSAPLARRLAPELCYRDPADGQSCAWYHGLWQFLRIMQLVEGLQYQAAFFREAFATIRGGADGPRVLVSGAADYGMLACTLAAFRARGVEPRVTVVDRCQTPLMLNRWYAERVGAVIEAQRCDLLEYRSEQPFDAICTHALLGRFAPPQRPLLAERWRSLLRTGGAVITVTPFRPGDGPLVTGFAPDQVRAFRTLVADRARGMCERLGPVRPEEMADAAEQYATRHRVYRVRSEQELREMFERPGLRLEQLSFSSPTAYVRNPVRGPTIAGNVPYARIVARRVSP